MRPFTELIAPGDPDPSKEVAAEILRRHRHEAKLIGELSSPTPSLPT